MANPVFKTTGSGNPGCPPGAARRATRLELKAGEYVFREGDLGTEMYIINEGKVEILNQVGDEEQLLAVLEKGDFFGEMSVLEDLPRAASARAADRRPAAADQRLDLRPAPPGQPRDRRAHDAQALAPPARDGRDAEVVLGTKVDARARCPRPVVQARPRGRRSWCTSPLAWSSTSRTAPRPRSAARTR